MAKYFPTPTPTPMSAVDAQQLQILHQIQSGNMSNTKMLELYLSYMNGLPVPWRLAIYHFLSSLPLPQLTAMDLTLIIILGPFLFFALLFAFILFLRHLIRTGVPLTVLGLLPKKKMKKIILQLTFPADTSKSAYATEELYSLLHTLARQGSFMDRLRHDKNEYALEIVSTKKDGIRYQLVTGEKFAEIIKRNLLSYLPGIQIKEVADSLPAYLETEKGNFVGLEEFKLSGHFALPLETQKALKEHDPISYLTGNMTKLGLEELVVFQVITTPLLSHIHQKHLYEMGVLRSKMVKGEPLTPVLQKDIFQKFTSLPGVSILWVFIKIAWTIVFGIFTFVLEMISYVAADHGITHVVMHEQKVKPQQILNPYEQELSTVVKGKIDQKLFETSIRLLVVAKDKNEVSLRLNGLLASFGQMSSAYQSLTTKSGILSARQKNQIEKFTARSLSNGNLLHKNPILSVSELSDLFHFPYTNTTKTEDMAKVHSVELPAPLAVKNNQELDVVFGKNAYAGSEIEIGLTDNDRSRHVLTIGQTGSGKTTVLFHMAKDDIEKGRGVAIVDPHGDFATDLLSCIPKKRLKDCIYFYPFDVKYPIGINLLELPIGLDEDELEQEKELVCESVISIFRRLFNQDESTNAHRIEYILRNTIYTAFTVKDATIFTVYELLTNPKFQKSITKNLVDENLKNFWTNEFGKAGNYQVVKMVGGVTAKIGRFLFSPTAKRIFEQPVSTINFDDILNQSKILICNLSEGKIGEDTSQLLGTTIIAKIHLAAMRRARKEVTKRTPFYVFIDEFQNFAVPSFTKLLSGGRKFGLRLTIAEQSTAQQTDRNMVNVILANVGTVICFRTASPIDENLMLNQFSPYVTKEDIVNLPQYHFYMKLSAVKPEEPFSGVTLPITIEHDEKLVLNVITASRKKWTKEYKRAALKQTPKTDQNNTKNDEDKEAKLKKKMP